MDPDANWKEMSECTNGPNSSDDQMDQRCELAQALQQWLRSGGFPPNITGHTEFDRLVAESTCDRILNLR